jgi:UDP-2,3-diacylglucosamine pyrophosphatase LpxH
MRRYRTVFLSDVHLGAAGCRTEAVQEFLKEVDSDHLYLVGDIIDGWVGSRESKWRQEHTNVIRTLLGKSKRDCVVRYAPGNHDAFMRRLNGAELGNIEVDHEFVHDTARGKRLLVVHGDLFDRSCTTFRPIAYMGAWMYEFMVLANASVNQRRSRRDRRPVDFASGVKRLVKRAIGRKTGYETVLADYARERGFHGVVCGHVHRPALEWQVDGFAYANCGDWVEHGTALVEDFDGNLSLLWWIPQAIEDAQERKLAPNLAKRR